MKIIVFLLLFVTFQVYCENGYSQSSRVNIADANLKVSDLLSLIELQTDYLFVYNEENVDVKRIVNVRAENRPVSEVLDRAFEGTGIRYVMEGTNIVLTRKSVDNVLQQPTTITVKGTVVDQKGTTVSYLITKCFSLFHACETKVSPH